jgi:hypothetical protein
MKDRQFNISDPGDGNKKIPASISQYIRRYFDKELLTEIKISQNNDGAVHYLVNISQDNTLYHLKFNSEGVLVQKESEPLIELLDDETEITD